MDIFHGYDRCRKGDKAVILIETKLQVCPTLVGKKRYPKGKGKENKRIGSAWLNFAYWLVTNFAGDVRDLMVDALPDNFGNMSPQTEPAFLNMLRCIKLKSRENNTQS